MLHGSFVSTKPHCHKTTSQLCKVWAVCYANKHHSHAKLSVALFSSLRLVVWSKTTQVYVPESLVSVGSMVRLVDVMVILSEGTMGTPSFLHEIETGFCDVIEQLNCPGLPRATSWS